MKKFLTVSLSILTAFGIASLFGLPNLDNLLDKVENDNNYQEISLMSLDDNTNVEKEVSNSTQEQSFKELNTRAKLKFSFNSDLQLSNKGLQIKFGVRVPANAYNTGAKHGMVVIPTDKKDYFLPEQSLTNGTMDVDKLDEALDLNHTHKHKYAREFTVDEIEKVTENGEEYYQYAWVLILNKNISDFYSFTAVSYEENEVDGARNVVISKEITYSISKMIEKYLSMNLFPTTPSDTEEEKKNKEELNKNVKAVMNNYSEDRLKNVFLNEEVLSKPESKGEGAKADYDKTKNSYLYTWGEGNMGQWLEVNDINNIRVSSNLYGAVFAQFSERVQNPSFDHEKILYKSKDLDSSYLLYTNMNTYEVDLNVVNKYISNKQTKEALNLDNFDLYAFGINDTKHFYRAEKVTKDENGKMTYQMSDRMNEVLFTYVKKGGKYPFNVTPNIVNNKTIVSETNSWDYKDVVAMTPNAKIQNGTYNYDDYTTINDVTKYMDQQPIEGQMIYAWVSNGGTENPDKFIKVNNNTLYVKNCYKNVSFLIVDDEILNMHWNYVEGKNGFTSNHKIYQSATHKIENAKVYVRYEFELDRRSNNSNAIIEAVVNKKGTINRTIVCKMINDTEYNASSGNDKYEFYYEYINFDNITINRKSPEGNQWNTSNAVSYETYLKNNKWISLDGGF